jgi:hypothetical protein
VYFKLKRRIIKLATSVLNIKKMNKVLLLFWVLFCAAMHAQTGINTTTPQGVLHVDPLKNNGTGTVSDANAADDFIVSPGGDIGIGTVTIDPSAHLQINATTQGFLPPRVTLTERDAIAAPADGLVIYNTTDHCLQVYQATAWSACLGQSGSIINITADTHPCFKPDAPISKTLCSQVTGAVLNDDPATTGIEYDYDAQVGTVDYIAVRQSDGSRITQSLVELNGQCWFARWSDKTDSPVNTINTGASGSHIEAAKPWTGRAYSHDLAFGVATTSTPVSDFKPQGPCPANFHVVNDCEFMNMEIFLGMPPIRAITGDNSQTLYYRTTDNNTQYNEDVQYVDILPALVDSSGLNMAPGYLFLNGSATGEEVIAVAPGFLASVDGVSNDNITTSGSRRITYPSTPRILRESNVFKSSGVSQYSYGFLTYRPLIRCIAN